MATDKYPNQNVNMPMTKGRVEAARARLTPPRVVAGETGRNGNGSLREVRAGEFVDDRRIEIGGPASPSKDSPPDVRTGRSVPASYDPLKAYQVVLGMTAVFAGRTLSPGKTYQMTGDTCTEVSASIIDAVELGAVPVNPDATPSGAR